MNDHSHLMMGMNIILKNHSIQIETNRQGTYPVSNALLNWFKKTSVRNGQINIFCRHTSCSLIIMENADPTARNDLEKYLNRLVPENDPEYTHTLEGPDDMPSHIKMALTRTSETIPVVNGELALGTWQGLFLWEHRSYPQRRELVFSIIGTN